LGASKNTEEEDHLLKISSKLATSCAALAALVVAASVASYPIRAGQPHRPVLDLSRIRTAESGAPACCLVLHGHLVHASATDEKPWTAGDIISGEDLSKLISSGNAAKPVILQVGIEALYREARIPDSIFAGPAAEPEGTALLKSKVKTIPHNKEIVIYCGCCPWQNCPNIKPAFIALHQLGFKKVKLLNIPTDFHQDWVNKGFPTVRS
jgi:hypothetical protein